MEIKKKWGNITKAMLFNMSKGNGCTLLKNVDEGTQFKCAAACIMTDNKGLDIETGKEKTKDILHIVTTDGAIYTTESPTVIGTFTDACTFMEDHELEFTLFRAKSKNGRQYMDLRLEGLEAMEG